MKRQVVLLMGPTAVGKTDVAMALQDQFGGKERVQLISADSAMIYRGMDVGSAKPSPAELASYPHDLVDIREPEDPYSVADFVHDADRCVTQAFAAGKLPVIVGGTMLYLMRFYQGIATLPQADSELRALLQAQFDREGGASLHAELAAKDPQVAANIHPNNPQRLLRAVEIMRLTGRGVSEQWQELASPSGVERVNADILPFAVVPDDRKALHARIEARFDAMLAAGFKQELKMLRQRSGWQPDLPAMRAVGYRQGFAWLNGELDDAGFRADAITATRRLAKRQLTWIRGWSGVHSLTWGSAPTLAAEIFENL